MSAVGPSLGRLALVALLTLGGLLGPGAGMAISQVQPPTPRAVCAYCRQPFNDAIGDANHLSSCRYYDPPASSASRSTSRGATRMPVPLPSGGGADPMQRMMADMTGQLMGHMMGELLSGGNSAQAAAAAAHQAELARRRAEAERQERIARAARLRQGWDERDRAMSNRLAGLFDVEPVRRAGRPEPEFVGVAGDGDPGDASVVDLRDARTGRASAGALERDRFEVDLRALDSERRARETAAFDLSLRRMDGALPQVAADTRSHPVVARLQEEASGLVKDIRDDLAEKALVGTGLPGAQTAFEIQKAERDLISDWQTAMNPERIARAARDGGPEARGVARDVDAVGERFLLRQAGQGTRDLPESGRAPQWGGLSGEADLGGPLRGLAKERILGRTGL